MAPTIATPASEEDLAALIRQAAEARRPVVTVGSGTKRHLGPAAPAEASVVSLANIARITAYEPGDMVVSVEAGVRLAELQRTLSVRGQWLPLDPPYADATIGGILATASSGPRRLGYGTAKDLLLGMRVLGPRGGFTRSGGRVVKNVTGYDLHKLHVGAFGSLGVLVEAHFKVRPRPEVSGAIVFGCADLETAHRLLLEVWGSPLRPVALEAASAAAAAGLRALAPGLPAGEALAVVGVEASRSVFDRHVRELEAWRARATAMSVLRGSTAEVLWAAFRDAADRRREEIAVRIGARPHDLPALLRELEAGGRGGVSIHAGNGIARAWLRPEDAARIRGWHERAAARAGYAVVEAAPLDLAGRADLPWGTIAHGVGRAIKHSWDPDRIMNPGRMVA